MPRGGLSKDPEKARRQAEILAAGRAIAAERRAKGLPTKRTEEARANGTGRVAQGRYRSSSSSSSKPAAKPATAKPKPTRRPTDAEQPPKEPGKLVRAYGRILGYV